MLVKLNPKKIKITTSESVANLIRGIINKKHRFDREKEHFYAIGLTRSNYVKFIDMVSLGSLHGTIAEPREVFRRAVLEGASSLILAHTHPSGNRQPSNADISTTKELAAAGKILRIQVIDHVIVCDEEYYSFGDEGLI